MRTKLFNALKVSTLALLISFGLSFVYAWTAPTVSAPNGNVSAPINTSSTGQTKLGSFIIGDIVTPKALTVFGTIGVSGDIVSLGTTTTTRLKIPGSTAGQVLTALDANGYVGWQTPTGGGGSSGIGTMTTYTNRTMLGLGGHPQAIAFGGAYMWSANNGNAGNGSITRISPLGTIAYPLPVVFSQPPTDIAFDGNYIWVANGGTSVIRVSPTGAMNTYSLGAGANARNLAFDGTNMWAASDDTVTKFDPNNPSTKTTYTNTGTGLMADAIAFDGTNMWVANYMGSAKIPNNYVTRVTPSGGMTTCAGSGIPTGLAFDGNRTMWVANDNGSITNFDTNDATCSTTATYPGIGTSPQAIAFDGTYMWLANFTNPGSVTRFSPADPAGTKTTYPYSGGGANLRGIAFDGTYMWTADSLNSIDFFGTVTKIKAI